MLDYHFTKNRTVTVRMKILNNITIKNYVKMIFIYCYTYLYKIDTQYSYKTILYTNNTCIIAYNYYIHKRGEQNKNRYK